MKYFNRFLAVFLLVCTVAFFGRVVHGHNAIRYLYRFAWGGSEEALPQDSNPEGDGIWNYNETNVFWVSAGHYNCDPDSDHTSEGGATDNPIYPSCPAGQNDIPDYAVEVPSSPGPVKGSAWTSYGWLDFEYTPDAVDLAKYPATGGYPGLPATSAFRDANDHVRGWARFRSLKSDYDAGKGDWEGWVRLCQNNNNPTWCLNIDDNMGMITGYAWNGEVAVTNSPDEQHARFYSGNWSSVMWTSPTVVHGLGWIKFDGPDGNGVRISKPPGVILTGNSVVQLGTSETLPKTITINWDVSGDALISCSISCDAADQADCGGWDSTKTISVVPGSRSATGTDNAISLKKAHVVFRMTCIGGGGIESTGELAVSAICYDRECNYKDEVCASIPHITNMGAVCIESCSGDGECVRPDVNWKEVSP